MTGKVDYNEDEFKFDLRTMLDDPMGQVSLGRRHPATAIPFTPINPPRLLSSHSAPPHYTNHPAFLLRRKCSLPKLQN